MKNHENWFTLLKITDLSIKEIFDDAKSDKLKAAVSINYHNPSKTLTVCTWNKSIFFFDLRTNPALMTEGIFGELLEEI